MDQYLVLSFYLLHAIKYPENLVKKFHAFFAKKDMKGRIYISTEGINAQLTIHRLDLELFSSWLKEHLPSDRIKLKIQSHPTHAFPKMTVKVRKELVALHRKVDWSLRGEHLSPKQWAAKLEEKNEHLVVLDVRNDYEWEVGHFERTEKPMCKNFREFPAALDQLAKKWDRKKTEILMSCTGGIRCEFFSCLVKEKGFEKVYQLEGGVLEYGKKVGTKHWLGELFVFDDRVVVSPVDGKICEPIGHCLSCNCLTSRYYNCANMNCNHLFLSCLPCTKKHLGCCSLPCMHSPKRRFFDPKDAPRPFKKLSHKEKIQLSQHTSPH